jgi:two-component system, OmpR family, alkaline phosphatase synthesis response regulator PhoP
MQRILIVSQDAAHIRAAEAAARADSRIVRSEATSEGCLIAVREWRPALVILDLAIGLTSGGLAALMRDEAMADGVATLAIAAPSQLPLVNSGAQVDDFIMTPVDEDELRIRLSRLVREQSGADESNVIRHGPLIIDLERYKVTIDSDVVDLTYKEYELLRFLASNPGKPFTREALLNQVWGYDYYGGSRTVDVHVRRIRAKIESREMFIDTVRNVGYRFVETYQAARRGASR